MKKIYFVYFICALGVSALLSSCFDEKDFALDKMTDTTVNPHLHMNNILSTEITMSDFFNIDSIVDSAQNVQLNLMTETIGADSMQYWEFLVGIDSTLRPTIPSLPEPAAQNFDIPLQMPFSGTCIPQSEFFYPDISQPMAVSSTQLPLMDNGQSLDSVAFSAGQLVFSCTSDINHETYMIFECDELRNRTTGGIFLDTIKVSNAGQSGTHTMLDSVALSNYILSSSSTSTINFKYRVMATVGGTVNSSYNIHMDIQFHSLHLDYVWGNIGTQTQWFQDIQHVSLFDDKTIAKIFGGSTVSLEKMTLNLGLTTNMGLPVNITFDTLWMLNDKTNTHIDLFLNNDDRLMGISAAANMNSTGSSSKQIELNTHVADNLPNKLIYAGKIDANPLSQFGFERFDSWINMSMRLHIPFKVKITNLEYEVDLDRLNLGTDAEKYTNNASLILNITNYFPCSIGTVIRCYDKDSNQIGGDIMVNNEMVKGANIDSYGNILSPSQNTTTVKITKENVRCMNAANKIKLFLTLNTSSSSSSQPYIRFQKDSRIKVNVGVDFESNVTINK